MRFALLLRGMALCHNYRHPNKNRMIIDYKKSVENYKEYIFKNNYVDVFYHTYYSSDLNLEELNYHFKPKRYSLTMDQELEYDLPNLHKYQSCIYSFMTVLNLFHNYYINHKCHYDYIIITRFDLLFKLKINSLILERDTFIISCMTENPRLMDDNFFMCSHNLSKYFLHLLGIRNNSRMLHFDYETFCTNIGIKNIRILVPGNYIVSYGTPLYSIVRHKICNLNNRDIVVIFNVHLNKYIAFDYNIVIFHYPDQFKFIKKDKYYNIVLVSNNLSLSQHPLNIDQIHMHKNPLNFIVEKIQNESYYIKTLDHKYLTITNNTLTLKPFTYSQNNIWMIF